MKLVLTFAALLAALSIVPAASAGDWPDSRLDQIATAIVGQPTHVFCEDDYAEWDSISVNVAHAYPEALYGFTYPTNPAMPLFMQPHICQSLHVALSYGPEEVGPYWFALAMHVLDHEATHKRLRSFDEGLVDCYALNTLDAGVLRNYWHEPDTVSQQYIATKVVKRRVGGKLVRRTVRYVATRQVPNRFVTSTLAWDHAWHKSLPPSYQGGCS